MTEVLPEILAPPAAAPVSEQARLKLIDALRGVALLGILLMNIPLFAMPNYFSESFKTDPRNVNFWVSAVVSVFFEGKMRALFGMIFGAGVLLFVSKKEQAGRSVTALFYRRMFWLVLFGLIHAHLILWIGDILYLYGFCGMIVYLFRKMKPIYLVMGVPLVAVVGFTVETLGYQYFVRAPRIAYAEASAVAAANKPLIEGTRESAHPVARPGKNDDPQPRGRPREYEENEVGLCHRCESSAAPGMEIRNHLLANRDLGFARTDAARPGLIPMGISVGKMVEPRLCEGRGDRLRHRFATGRL